MRSSYRDDGSFLLRLEAAIGKDTRQSEAWRDETRKLVRALALRLLEADKPVEKSAGSASRKS